MPDDQRKSSLIGPDHLLAEAESAHPPAPEREGHVPQLLVVRIADVLAFLLRDLPAGRNPEPVIWVASTETDGEVQGGVLLTDQFCCF